jgi:hypothetical protein
MRWDDSRCENKTFVCELWLLVINWRCDCDDGWDMDGCSNVSLVWDRCVCNSKMMELIKRVGMRWYGCSYGVMGNKY